MKLFSFLFLQCSFYILHGQCNINSILGNYTAGSCGEITFQSSTGAAVSLYGGCGSFQFAPPLLDNEISTNSVDFVLNNVTINPNPSLGYSTIKSDITIKNITILNLIGKEIYNSSNPFTELNLDMSSYPSGSYIFKLSLENNKIINKQIVVIHH